MKRSAVEVWKWIPGYKGLYKISTLGSVKSFKKDVEGSLLVPSSGRGGYKRITLRKDSRTKTRGVHNLILRAFVGPPLPGHQARHLNGVRTDNRLVNLKWGTPEQNCADRDLHGTTARADTSGQAKLTAKQVKYARSMYAHGVLTHKQLAATFGVAASTIHRAVAGISWRSIAREARYRPSVRATRSKLSSKKARSIRKDFSSGSFTMRQLAIKYSVSSPTIVGIVRGKYYTSAGGLSCVGVRTTKATPRKLTEAKVAEIRKLYRSGKQTQVELAAMFSVSGALISQIVRNKIWV